MERTIKGLAFESVFEGRFPDFDEFTEDKWGAMLETEWTLYRLID